MQATNETEPIRKIFNLPVIKKTERNNIKKIRIFNIPIYKKYKRNGYNIRKYLFGLIKTKTNQNHKKIYLFDIQILCKKLLSDYERLRNEINSLREFIYQINWLPEKVSRVHLEVFPRFMNKHTGENIVIAGTGPTLTKYNPPR